MSVFEICTLDSAYVRVWRWLASAHYRRQIRELWRERPFYVTVGTVEALALSAAEVVVVWYLFRWMSGL